MSRIVPLMMPIVGQSPSGPNGPSHATLRRSFLANCGVISLTCLTRDSFAHEPRQEVDEPTEVVVSEMRSARADSHERIVWNKIGPLPR
jgi:hypothetical protein